jgi:hypothetical protein
VQYFMTICLSLLAFLTTYYILGEEGLSLQMVRIAMKTINHLKFLGSWVLNECWWTF